MLAFKQQCIALRKKDHTLPEIAEITGRPKTSVYFHIQNVPLSTAKLQAIRAVARARIARAGEARKGKSKKFFKKISTWTPRTVFLVAHLLFDGQIQRVSCVYNNRSQALVTAVAEAMSELYTFPPRRYRNSLTGVLRITYNNVALGEYMQTKSVELLNDITTFTRPLKREFLKAFFDDEGCIDFRPLQNRRSVRGYQKRVYILEIIQKLLSDFGIVSSVKKPNEVVIAGKVNLLRFEKEIGFSRGVTVNGNRSNSRWKQHLEKREILRRAITSFRTQPQISKR